MKCKSCLTREVTDYDAVYCDICLKGFGDDAEIEMFGFVRDWKD